MAERCNLLVLGIRFGFCPEAEIDEDDQQGEHPLVLGLFPGAITKSWCFTARLKNDGRINEFSHHVLPLPLPLSSEHYRSKAIVGLCNPSDGQWL
ncbi:hypothetical protein V6N13_120417 [Hibiscus sabdariffa]